MPARSAPGAAPCAPGTCEHAAHHRLAHAIDLARFDVEPVFGTRRANKRLDRFTLRGRTNVGGQWQRYCLVHNIGKLAHHGYAA